MKLSKEDRKKRREKIELKIYQFLGVKQFRALTFKLEKLVHIKDKKQNHNYHINPDSGKSLINCTIDEMEDFKKKLYYNGSIHVKNLIFLAITSLVILIVPTFNKYLLILNLVLAIKDAYCVMLQRYNYIRISNTIDKRKCRLKSKVEKTTNQIVKQDNLEITKFNSMSVDKILLSAKTDENISFDINDKEQLYQLREFLINNKKLFESNKVKTRTKGLEINNGN